jgi:tellurite resistance protein TerC
MRRPNLTPGFDNLGRAEPGEADAHTHPTEDKSFWSVVLTVELANLAFSLDNLVVAVAVSDKLWAVLLGVFIGSLIMRFAISIAIIVVSLLYAHVK